MMASMKHASLLCAGLALLLPSPAAAQFYDLDGTYRCVTAPSDACAKNLRDQPRPAPPPAPGGPSLDQVIAKVRDKSVGPRELEVLEKQAATGDPRAVEVLAWCKLNGLGTAADVVGAYWLYRQAATLGVANARQNQIAIYETRLTPEQRQQVLMRESSK